MAFTYTRLELFETQNSNFGNQCVYSKMLLVISFEIFYIKSESIFFFFEKKKRTEWCLRNRRIFSQVGERRIVYDKQTMLRVKCRSNGIDLYWHFDPRKHAEGKLPLDRSILDFLPNVRRFTK